MSDRELDQDRQRRIGDIMIEDGDDEAEANGLLDLVDGGWRGALTATTARLRAIRR